MLYCHDSYGLGHLRRVLALSRYLRARRPGISQLIVTGSPLAHDLVLPTDADYLKLPSVVKVGAGHYAARSLKLSLRDIRDLRRDILFAAARHFRPDILVVDHAPAGLEGEIVPTLRYLRESSPQTRLVLGLRDILDEGSRVRRAWLRDNVYDLLDNVYDLILVYGDQEAYDVVAEYGLSERAASKTKYVGYLGRGPARRQADELRGGLGLRTGRLVLVTAGGGEDGYELFRTTLEACRDYREARSLDWLLVSGPLMPPADRRRLRELVPRAAPVRCLDFVDDLPSYVAAADAVVSMGGYNTVCEILSAVRPAVIVPRIAPRKEQLIRAEVLRRRGLARMIHPHELEPPVLLGEVQSLLEVPAATPSALPLKGLPRGLAELERVLTTTEGESAQAAAGSLR